MLDCVFCKIIQGEISANKVYEDNNLLAFLDIQPISKGHTLLIPKEHFDDFIHTSDEYLAYMNQAAKVIAKAMQSVLSAGGINFSYNNGKVAGQVIFHTHMHIIPRVSGDGLRAWPHQDYQPGEIESYAKKLADAINL